MQFVNTISDEVKDIAVAVSVLTFAFLLLDIVDYGRVLFVDYAWLFVSASLLSVITAFLLHELSHRHVARVFGQVAYFKLWPLGALLALVTSLFGIIFAAPGAVYYHGYQTDHSISGKISLAGPAMNLLVGTMLAAAGYITSIPDAAFILLQAARLNFWFGLFNMIPLWQLDGAKVILWSREAFLVAIAIALLGTVLLGY